MTFYKQLLLTSLVLCTISAMGQPSLQKIKSGINNKRIANIERYDINPDKPFMATMLLKKDATVQLSGAKKWLGENMQMRASDDLKMFNRIELNDGFVVEKHQQYYKGIKVEFGMVSFCAKAGKLQMTSMEFYSIPDDFNTVPTLTEEQALSKAMGYIGAKKYAWEGYTGTDSTMQKPKGELVIIKDFNEAGNKMCLAYKFLVQTEDPLSLHNVYIDAGQGTMLLKDDIARYENAQGSANTVYSGTQKITTDLYNFLGEKRYRLQEVRNGYTIKTLDGADPAVKDISSKDNNQWPDKGRQIDLPALDVHFNTEVTSDYWWNIHHRKSWDGCNSPIISYVHVNIDLYGRSTKENAFWDLSRHTLNFGDGKDGENKPYVPLDICAHEFGHGVLQSMGGLNYWGESGAINEGLSDIWATCVKNYANKYVLKDINQKNVWLFGSEVEKNGIRNIKNPKEKNQPDTYKSGSYWSELSSFLGITLCDAGCVVHTNSGVLNKWFYLLTEGGSGTNSAGFSYNVEGVTFQTSEKLIYLTECLLCSDAQFVDVARISIGVAERCFGSDPKVKESVEAAWRAVGVPFLDDINNIASFTSNDFASIGVDNKSNIYAGTFKKGTYRFNGINWQPLNAVTTGFAPSQNATGEVILQSNAIHAIVADNKGGIWIAQSGDNSMTATDGGLEYFPDSSTRIHYGATKGVPTRAVRSVFVDTTGMGADGQPVVWVVSSNTTTGGTLDRGGLGRGVNNAGQPFTTIREGLQTAPGLGYCQTVGGDATEIWVYAFDNYNRSQVLRYNAQTNAFIGFYDSTNIGNKYLAKNFQAKSIYFDAHKNKWLGMLNGGLTILDSANKWHKINFPSIFKDTTYVNDNAIIGDNKGLVYIGTNSGLVVYNGGALDSLSSYTITFNTGALGANIRGMAIDKSKDKLIMATSKGIMYYVCPSCLARDLTVTNTGSGKWSDPLTWDNGKVPDGNTNVVIIGAVQVDINGVCNSLRIKSTGQLTIQKGKKLDVVSPSSLKYND